MTSYVPNETLALKPVPRRAALNIAGRQYRLEAGAESITLPADDAAVLRAVYPHLLADAPVVPVAPPRPKKAVAPAADAENED